MENDKLNIFIPLAKVDEEKRLIYARLLEEPDSAGDIMDYTASKPSVQEWSDYFQRATGGKSFGNLRVQHDVKREAGHFTQIGFSDADKAIDLCAKVNDDVTWKRVLDGDYTGVSIGGSFAKRWRDGQYTRYVPNLVEISLVDLGMLKSATFDIIKADGTVEKHAFSQKERDDAADAGQALPDGSFPIKTKEDLENAVHAYGRAKDKEAAKAHIIKRAKALDATDMLPSDWEGSTKKEAAAKADGGSDGDGSEHEASRLAHEASAGAVDGPTHEHAAAAHMLASEAQHKSGNVDAAAYHHRMAVYHANEAEKARGGDMAQKAAKAEALQKAGARHSSEDRDHIQAIHDHAASLGAVCSGEEKESKNAAAAATDLQKAEGERTNALAKVAALEGTVGRYDKVLAKVFSLAEGEKVDLDKIEALPDLAKVATKDLAKAVGKEEDIGALDKVEEPPKDALSAIKKAHQAPKQLVIRPALIKS